MIADRQRKYPLWRLIHLLGSLKLALLLLATIAIAIAVATFTEAHFDAAVARAWIYKAPWFIAWLGVLCINLFAVTLTRWPWQEKHAGFIITHYGIILLLIGAVIGSKFGFEGNITLRTDGEPQRRVITDQSTLQIESPADSYLYLLPFDAKLTHPSEKHPTVLPIPGTALKMVIDGSSEQLVRTPFLAEAEGNTAGTAVLLDFSSHNINQFQRIALGTGERSPAEYDFFGLAKVQFFPLLPTHPENSKKEFITVTAGATPQHGISLSKDGSMITLRPSESLSAGYRVSEVMNREISLGNLHAIVRGPTSTATTATKTSLEVELPGGENFTTTHASGKPWLELAPGPLPGTMSYQLGRSAGITSAGTLASGDSLSLGWADWKLKLVQIAPHHEVESIVEPSTENVQSPVPGFHAYLKSSTEEGVERGRAQWVPSGEVTPLLLGQNLVRVGYGLELRPIPFSIRLIDFEVPRDEGTETPSDFRATVRFKNITTGAEIDRSIRMNHPASYPGGLLANITGLNYKFSQAEWNPRDLKETTLQVLYDPGWFFKWTGSLAICLGIATMFYIRPRA